jgi:hypothetical protein
MNENNKTKAGEWFEKARRDFEAAKVLINAIEKCAAEMASYRLNGFK